jgi:hypothetical protein
MDGPELREVKSLLLTLRYYASWHAVGREELRRLVADLSAVVEGLEA